MKDVEILGIDSHIGSQIIDLDPFEDSMERLVDLYSQLKEKNISIGIVAVPSNQAQSVIDILVDNGITGILNYAPIAPFAPTNVVMKNIDPVLSLQSMTFHMKEHEELNQI